MKHKLTPGYGCEKVSEKLPWIWCVCGVCVCVYPVLSSLRRAWCKIPLNSIWFSPVCRRESKEPFSSQFPYSFIHVFFSMKNPMVLKIIQQEPYINAILYS